MSIGRVPGATGIQPSIVDAKGDLIVATAADSVSRLAVGTNNQVLMADSTQATGLKYANEATATLTTTGDLLYASAANTPARLGIGSTDQVLKVSGGIPAWGATPSPTFVGCRLYSSSAQNLTNNTATAINFDLENFDSDGFHSTTTNNTRITIPTGKAGKYLFTGHGEIQAGGGNMRYSLIRKNGTTIEIATGTSNASARSNIVVTCIADAVAGDYFELFLQQDSGGTIVTYDGTASTSFGCTFLGA